MTDCEQTKSEITERLESMGVLEDPDMAESLLRAFLDSAHVLRSELSAALGKGDPESYRAAAHTLKGATRNLNANHLADLCTVIESESADAPLEDPLAAMASVDAEFTVVIDIVHELIQQVRVD